MEEFGVKWKDTYVYFKIVARGWWSGKVTCTKEFFGAFGFEQNTTKIDTDQQI